MTEERKEVSIYVGNFEIKESQNSAKIKSECFSRIIAIRIDRRIGNENKYPLTALTLMETIFLNSDNGNLAVSNDMTIGTRVPIGLICLYLVTKKKSCNRIVTARKGRINK